VYDHMNPKQLSGFEFLEENAGKKKAPVKYSDSLAGIMKKETREHIQKYQMSEMIRPKAEREVKQSLLSSTYSPYDALAQNNKQLGGGNQAQVQDSKGKKGKKKAVGVLVDAQPMHEPARASKLAEKESKQSWDPQYDAFVDADGFTEVGNKESSLICQSRMNKNSKKQQKAQMEDLAEFVSKPAKPDEVPSNKESKKKKKEKQAEESGADMAQWNKLQGGGKDNAKGNNDKHKK